MPIITLKTLIEAPSEICFDLSRSIDLHIISTQQTGEKAIAGVTSGLIGLGESVTWRAKHFGIWQTLTSKVTEFDHPHRFVDEMVEGAFRHFHHEHRFEESEGGTLMTDVFEYSVPYGLIGRIFDQLILYQYMTGLLAKRNLVIKKYATSEKWKAVLSSSNEALSSSKVEFYNFQVMKRLFEELWFASENAQLPIKHMWFRIKEVAQSLEVKQSSILPYVRLLIDEGIINQVSEEPLLHEFTSKGVLIKCHEDIHDFLRDNKLPTL